MRKKIAILGTTGQLGHMIYNYLKEKELYDIIPISRKDFNLQEENDIYNLISFLEYKNIDFIVNCIGVLIKQSEENFELAKLINSRLPKILEKQFQYTNTKIIHISTNCVFNGKGKNIISSYTEESIPNETSNYGVTKINGEINNNKDLTIRTSTIGPELNKNGTGLFHWFMNQKEKCYGYTNHYWNGVTNYMLAQIIELCFYENLTGIKHIYNPEIGIFSKCDIVYKINEIFSRNVEIFLKSTKEDINKILKTIYDNPFLKYIKSYDEQLIELKEWILNHEKLYKEVYPGLF